MSRADGRERPLPAAERPGEGRERGNPQFALLSTTGASDVAFVTAAETRDGHRFDFVDLAPRGATRDVSWTCLLSTLSGCPVRCPMCDAGGHYEGRLTVAEILGQLDVLVDRHFPTRVVPSSPWEVHFARMGDPAFNESVLDALRALPGRYDAPGLRPVLSTVAPATTDGFFGALLDVARTLYPGRLELQLSLHATDEAARRRVVPVRTWSFARMAEYGERFHEAVGRKVWLSFAAAAELPLEAARLREVFSPAAFSVRLTPLNPTAAVARAGLTSLLDRSRPGEAHAVAARFEAQGYEVVLALGDDGEDEAGASCGSYRAGGREGPPKPRRTLEPRAGGP